MAKSPRLRFRVRITVLGVVCLLLPLPLLVRGLLTSDAPSLIIGAGVISLVLLSFSLLLLSVPLVSKKLKGDSQRSRTLPQQIGSGRTAAIRINPRRPAVFPGLRYSLYWRMDFGARRYSIQALLPASGEREIFVCIPNRGLWRVQSFFREADLFGFFYIDWLYPGIQHLCVPPNPRESSDDKLPGRPSGDASTVSRLKDEAEEKLERRAYIPGDDPRRIDWKHYARLGGLLLRTGEQGIPFRGRIWVLVLGTAESADNRYGQGRRRKKDARYALDRLDFALETASALIRKLQRNYNNLMVFLPGESAWAEVPTTENEIGLQLLEERLAGSLPTPFDVQLLPAPGERLLVLAHPDEASAAAVSKMARSRACRVSLAFPSALPNPASQGTPDIPELSETWKALIFRSAADSLQAQRRNKAYRRALARAEFALESEALDVLRI